MSGKNHRPGNPVAGKNSSIRSFFKPVPPASPPRPDTDHPVATANTTITSVQISPAAAQLHAELQETIIVKSVPSPTESSFTELSMPSSSLPGSQATDRSRVVPSSDGEESDDSLEDPFETLRRQRRKIEPASGIKKTASSLHKPIPDPSSPVVDLPPPRIFKFSLGNLVAQKERSNALAKERQTSKALHAEANREIKTDFRGGEQEIDEGMMIQAFGEVEARKLIAALRRKDAWRVDKTWHFFDLERGKRRNPFPRQAVEGLDGWEAGLVTAKGRRQMFVSGFVMDMAKIDSVLPDEALVWLMDELCLEPKEDLAFAYSKVLGAIPIPDVQKLFTEGRVTRLFDLLGGKSDALDTEKPVVLADSGRIDDQDGNFYNAKLVTTLIGRIAPYICTDSAAIKKTCILLVRLSLDIRVARQAGLRASIEDALSELFTSIPDDDWPELSREVGLNLISTILDPPHRLRAVNTLPVHTPRTHLFRRRLALSYLWDDPSFLTKPYDDLLYISDLDKLLAEPQYKITKDTNYPNLKAHISMLDIAIDDGPTSNDEDNDAEIDILVERLRHLFGRIIDTNAQDLTRTEAKDTIERLNFRLRFAVRKKVKTHLVVDTDTGEWVGRDGMRQAKLPWGSAAGSGGAGGAGGAGDAGSAGSF